jgi:hypothetical protein
MEAHSDPSSDPPSDAPSDAADEAKGTSDPDSRPDQDSNEDSEIDTGLTGQELEEFDAQLSQLAGTQWEPKRGPVAKAFAWLIVIVMLGLFLAAVGFMAARISGLLP